MCSEVMMEVDDGCFCLGWCVCLGGALSLLKPLLEVTELSLQCYFVPCKNMQVRHIYRR